MNKARSGVLILGSLLLGNFPLPEGSDAPSEASAWEHFSERCPSNSPKTLSTVEADFRSSTP
jgi:hypothetical protein